MAEPTALYSAKRQMLDWQSERLFAAADRRIGDERRRFAECAAKLDALSPLKVLSRGYAIAEKDGVPVRRAEEAHAGDSVDVRLADGVLACTVEEVRTNG